jgi:hypothetical protein
MLDTVTGRGTKNDKLSRLAPLGRYLSPSMERAWYLSNGFMQNIVDGPAEDATREWITIHTNRDEDSDAGPGLGINRMIENRLAELKAQSKIKDLIRFSRMHQAGGFLYYGVMASLPQDDIQLSLPLPSPVRKLDFLNVFEPDHVAVLDNNIDPLSRSFHRKTFLVHGTNVHESRMAWMVHSYLDAEQRGISVVETVLDSITAQDTALWSVTSLIYEMSVKVFSSPDVRELAPEKIAAFLVTLKATLSTQGAAAIADDEKLERLESAGIADSGLKQLFDFIFENLAGTARMPKSRLMGQSQGVITAGQFDIISYYDSIAKFQELEMRPVLERIIELIVQETAGPVFKALAGNTDSLDWEFDFNPLWKVGPVERAEIELKEAQTDEIRIDSRVMGPDEARSRRFEDLESYSGWEDPAPVVNAGIPPSLQNAPGAP